MVGRGHGWGGESEQEVGGGCLYSAEAHLHDLGGRQGALGGAGNIAGDGKVRRREVRLGAKAMAMDADATIRWEGHECSRGLFVEAGQRSDLGWVETKNGLDAFQRCGIQMTGVGLGDDPVDEIVNSG